MKTFYTAPEAELIRFAPAESLMDIEDGLSTGGEDGEEN